MGRFQFNKKKKTNGGQYAKHLKSDQVIAAMDEDGINVLFVDSKKTAEEGGINNKHRR